MKETAKQPDADLAGLRTKVEELIETAKAKQKELLEQKEALRKKQEEEKTTEEKCLRDMAGDGANLAKWTLQPTNCPYQIDVLGFEHTCCNTRDYIDFLKTIFNGLKDNFGRKKDDIYNPKRKKKQVYIPPYYGSSRSFPASGIVIHDCCGGVNGHKGGCDCSGGNVEVDLDADELKDLNNRQTQEFESLKKEVGFRIAALHAHMEGFLEVILKSNPNGDAIVSAVKIAMIGDVDVFPQFGGRKKVLERLQTVVAKEIGGEISNADTDEAGLKEIERILNEVHALLIKQDLGK